jgi:Protein of unknown function (DUF2958)
VELFPDDLRRKMIFNNQNLPYDDDPVPVLKLFAPDANATWILTELDEETGSAFGLCDLGIGMPELGYVAVLEFCDARGGLGLPIERDLHFRARFPLSAYAKAAREHGPIFES